MDGATRARLAGRRSSGGIATFSTSTLATGRPRDHGGLQRQRAVLWRAPARSPADSGAAAPVTLITGADAGGQPHVRRFMALDGSVPPTGALNSFFAFDPSFTGGVRVAEGDVNGDGVPDYIAGAGPGGAPEVRIVDGATGALRASLVAFEPAFGGGVFVAAGDVNGDGFVDVDRRLGRGTPGRSQGLQRPRSLGARRHARLRDRVHRRRARRGRRRQRRRLRGSRRRRGPRRVDGHGPQRRRSARCCAPSPRMPGFTGGVFVAAGDVTGDGYADIVTGAGAGGGPHVRGVRRPHRRGDARLLRLRRRRSPAACAWRPATSTATGARRSSSAAGPGGAPEVRVFDPVDEHAAEHRARLRARLHRRRVRGDGGAGQPDGDRHAAAGATVRSSFTVSGWAFEDSTSAAGIAGIDVTAVPGRRRRPGRPGRGDDGRSAAGRRRRSTARATPTPDSISR